MKKTIYTEEQRAQMKELYLSGKSAIEVATIMNSDKGTVRRELQTMVTLRSKSESSRMAMGIKFVKSDAFDLLTPDALYWIGFMYADGFIEEKHPVLGISISMNDRELLEKFNNFLGGQLNITEIVSKNISRGLKGQITFGGTMGRIKVADHQLYNKLREFNFTGNKTSDIVPHELLKWSRDFWRGMIDGDGWLTVNHTTGDNKNENAKVYTYPKIGLAGNEQTIIEFLKFIELSGIKCLSGVKKAKREKGLYTMDAAGKSAVQIMNLLYMDATTYLERKYQKYLELMNNIL